MTSTPEKPQNTPQPTSAGLLADVLALQPGVAYGNGLSLDHDHAQAVIDAIVEVKALREVLANREADLSHLRAVIGDRARRIADLHHDYGRRITELCNQRDQQLRARIREHDETLQGYRDEVSRLRVRLAKAEAPPY